VRQSRTFYSPDLGVGIDGLETAAAMAEAMGEGKSAFDVLGAEINAQLGEAAELAQEAGALDSRIARVADYLTEDPPVCLANSFPAKSTAAAALAHNAATGNTCRFFVDLKGTITDLEGPQGLIMINKAAGDGYRNDLAAFFRMYGRMVVTDGEDQARLTFKTPYGNRIFDIEVRDDRGNRLGYVEAKTGGSPYSPAQQQKDEWLRQQYGFNIAVVRSAG
jgi:hypothetical protein